jgi:hypothetical protein
VRPDAYSASAFPRRILGSTLSILGPGGAGALAAEGILRLFLNRASVFTNHHRLFCEFDPQLGWRKKPNGSGMHLTPEYQVHERFNSRGLRGPEYPFEKPRNEYRVLFLGDSFTEGYSVHFHDLFSKRLELALNADGRKARYCCINAGTGGYSTDQELLFFMSEGRRYDPDLTVLMFYENDLMDNVVSRTQRGTEKPLFRLTGGELAAGNLPLAEPAAPAAPSPESMWAWAARTSYLLGLGSYSARQVAFVASMFRRKASTMRSGYSIPPGFGMWAEREPAEVQDAWRLTGALIGALRERVQEAGGRLLVFYVPSQAAVYPRLWRTMRNLYGLPAAGWRIEQVAVRLADCCARQGIELLDPTAEFRAEGERLAGMGERLYYPVDGHWNREGHRLAARILDRHIGGAAPQFF